MYTKVLVGKSESKGPYGRFRPIHIWDDNTEIDSINMLFKGADWIGLAQARDQWCAVMETSMNLRVPRKAGDFLIS
jgi:hypothetical protein